MELLLVRPDSADHGTILVRIEGIYKQSSTIGRMHQQVFYLHDHITADAVPQDKLQEIILDDTDFIVGIKNRTALRHEFG